MKGRRAGEWMIEKARGLDLVSIKKPVKYHSILEVPLARPAGASIPLLCIEEKDGGSHISRTAYLYCRVLQRRGFSVDKVHKFVRAMGLLSDFAKATDYISRPTTESGVRKLLEEFAEARLFGTTDRSGLDKLGLYWTPVKFSTANYDCILLAEFGEWLAESAIYKVDKKWESRFVVRVLSALNTSKRLNHSMFLHLKRTVKGSRSKAGVSFLSFRRIDRGRAGVRAYKDIPEHFPPESVIPLIRASHIRDQLVFILLAFGGPRVSEALQLYVDDVIGVDDRGCAI